jgi:type II secretory pathway pseudopilin PulG
MQRRRAFTIVEMLVAVALIILVMLVLTEAFSAGVETFSQLKALGDMQERLRAAATVLRRDLAADHFEGHRRLSDPNFWTDGYPGQGFFRISQGSASIKEGFEPDLVLPAPDVIAPVRATDHVLHLSVKLRGNGREDFFSANVPGSVVLSASTNFFAQPTDARYQDTPGTFNSQWAEVAYFLIPNGASAGTGTPLFTLYRSQFVVVPDNSGLANVPGTALAQNYEMSCETAGTALHFNTPGDLTNPLTRAYTAPTTATARGNFSATSPRNWAAAALLTDVISFDVRPLQYDLTAGAAGTYFADLSSFDTADPKATDPTSTQGPPTFVLKAVQISLRVWNQKTLQARQLTLVQDL